MLIHVVERGTDRQLSREARNKERLTGRLPLYTVQAAQDDNQLLLLGHLHAINTRVLSPDILFKYVKQLIF